MYRCTIVGPLTNYIPEPGVVLQGVAIVWCKGELLVVRATIGSAVAIVWVVGVTI